MTAKLKIIFSAGDRLSSPLTCKRIYQNLILDFDLRIAAPAPCRGYVPNIDWTLDALYNGKPHRHATTQSIIGEYYVPIVDCDVLEFIVEDIKKWEPDLIITDQEPVLLAVANFLKIPVWDISCLNLMWTYLWYGTGINSKEGYYGNLLYNFKRDLNFYAKADKYFIYSAFYKTRMPIEKHQRWIKPFSDVIVSNDVHESCGLVWNRPKLEPIFKSAGIPLLKYSDNYQIPQSSLIFSSGENILLSDLILNNVETIYLMPNLKDQEALVNACLIRFSRLGYTLGQIENMKYLAATELYKKSKIKFNSRLSKDLEVPTLTQIIKEEFKL